MFTSKKFRNRHLVLKVLQEHYDNKFRVDSLDNSEIEVSYQELMDKSKLSEAAIKEQINYLQNEKEILINEINFSSYNRISKLGRASYYDKKYLTLGKKKFLDSTLKVVTIISTIALLIIAIVSFLINI